MCPKAFVLIITNPVNSTLPIAVEVLKKHNVFDAKKVFGVTTLDVVRASAFLAHVLKDSNPKKYKIPVVGGHSGSTILPLYSQCKPSVELNKEQLDALTYRVQFGGDEIVQAKAGAGSATTCMAYAAFRFVSAILKADAGASGIKEEAYVYLPGVPGGQEIAKKLGSDYFGVPLDFGTGGAQKAYDIGSLADYEQGLVDTALDQLAKDIKKGLDFS